MGVRIQDRAPITRLIPALLLLYFTSGPALWGQRTLNDTLTLPTELPTGEYTFESFDSLETVLAIASAPDDIDALYFALRSGSILVYTNLESPVRQETPFLTIPSTVTTNGENGLLGLAFHPSYSSNGYFYVFYTSRRDSGQRTNRLSRFTRSASDPYLADPDSELILFDQVDQASNHNGGDIHFGPDGYLYISVGDEGGGNDNYDNSQVVDRDLFAGILRIDVDKLPGNLEPTQHPDIPLDPDDTARFRIPSDNPLVERWQNEGSDPESNLRLEFYAIGLRNPWRMSFDPATGNLWAGDVGQGAREEVSIIERGGNYGWAFREGFIDGPKDQTPPLGFETIVEPVHDYPRNLGVSITGGIVYRGTKLPGLEGAYVFGDYGSGRIWALFPDPDGGAPTVEQIASTSTPVAFGRDPSNGDILVASIDGNIRRLVAGSGEDPSFPDTLTQTGAFESLQTLQPASGILPYEPNVSFWSDYASKRRWVSVPDDTIQFAEDNPWTFPTGTVWIKHFELEMERGNPDSRVRVETRFLVKTPTSVYGISYQWNESQTEAFLVGSEGANIDYAITQNGEETTQSWRIPSRQECLQCHTAVAGYALSFNTRQLNRTITADEIEQNALSYFSEIGILDTPIENPASLPALVALDDETATFRERSRSYLAANCVSCHQPGGAAPNNWDARPHLALENTGLIGGGVVDDRGNTNRRLVVPGSPELSVLLSRVQGAHGYQRMPQIGSNELDNLAIELLSAWISSTPPSDATFNEWQIALFADDSAPEAAATADPDGDGNDNLLEYLTFTHPLDPSDFWRATFSRDQTEIQVDFTMPPTRVYSVQISPDLANWEDWDVPGNPPQADAVETLPARIIGPLPEDQSDAFLRVRIASQE